MAGAWVQDPRGKGWGSDMSQGRTHVSAGESVKGEAVPSPEEVGITLGMGPQGRSGLPSHPLPEEPPSNNLLHIKFWVYPQ